MTGSAVSVQDLGHVFEEGGLRRQVLAGIDAEIGTGEIVILTGPSGSGKTTLLTLMGGLRAVQSGSLRVLGEELYGTDESARAGIRRQIGYIFQSHNLLGALTSQENVEIALNLSRQLSGNERHQRSRIALESVGLGDRLDSYPSELSGGQRQRVAIARALSNNPKLILADEPTASLDRISGREVVELIQNLAKRKGTTVVLVTHDNRILDVADRILTLSDGRISSLVGQAAQASGNMLNMVARDLNAGHLNERVADLDEDSFINLMDGMTRQAQELLDLSDIIQGSAFRAVQGQVVSAFTQKAASLIGAKGCRLYFADENRENPWLVDPHGQSPGYEDAPEDIDINVHTVLNTGRIQIWQPEKDTVQRLDAADPIAEDGVVYVPLKDSTGRAFAVLRLGVTLQEGTFGESKKKLIAALAASCAAMLEAWWRMGCDCRRQLGEGSEGCCST